MILSENTLKGSCKLIPSCYKMTLCDDSASSLTTGRMRYPANSSKDSSSRNMPHGSYINSTRQRTTAMLPSSVCRRHCSALLLLLVLLLQVTASPVAASLPAVISGPESSVLDSKSKEDPNERHGSHSEDDLDSSTSSLGHGMHSTLKEDSNLPSSSEYVPKSEDILKANTKSTLDLLTKRLLAAKNKNTQKFMAKLKSKSPALKDANSKQKDTETSSSSLKSFGLTGKLMSAGDLKDYVYEDYQDPDQSQLEIKTESPPAVDVDDPVYKDCPMFANGELVGVRRHGAQWSDGDDQCEICACQDGEQRCYYHYCNGPKMGFITPPSAETPTTNGNNNNNVNDKNNEIFLPLSTLPDTIDTNTEQTGLHDSNEALTEAIKSRSRQQDHPSNTARAGLPATVLEESGLEEDTEDALDAESSGMQPWPFSDDDDDDVDDDDDMNYDYSYNIDHNGRAVITSNNVVHDSSSRRVQDSEPHENHVALMGGDDGDGSIDAFDPLDFFEAVADPDPARVPTQDAESASTAGSKSGRKTTACQTDCGKSCPYGYKMTSGVGCPSCKCLKCKNSVPCRLLCPAGQVAERHGCHRCTCSLPRTHGADQPAPPASVHHTLDGIQDTHRFSYGGDTADPRTTRDPSSSTSSSTSTTTTTSTSSSNDVMYQRHDYLGHSSSNADSSAAAVAATMSKKSKNIDPHNHFYDNAFNILKADELSILRDEDLSTNTDRTYEREDSRPDSGVGGPGRASSDGRDSDVASSLDSDDVYDVDYNVDYNTAADDDLTTTVDWEEVERRARDHEAHSGGQGKDCNHTAPPGCQDPAGTGPPHPVGSSWRRDPCTLCRCYSQGYAECTVTQCSPPLGASVHCSPPAPGDCCPRCSVQHHHRRGGDPQLGEARGYPLPAPHSGVEGRDPALQGDQRGDPQGGDAVKEAVRSDLSSICTAVAGLVGSSVIVACLAVHYWRRYHRAKYDIAATTAEEAQKLRPVKVNCCTEGLPSVTTPLKPEKCV